MNAEPEFEESFYQNQNSLMIERYKIIFKKNKLNWKKYYNYAKKQLRNNVYWLWIFLCGIEKLIQDNKHLYQLSEKAIYDDANQRIARIIGNHFQIQRYLDSL